MKATIVDLELSKIRTEGTQTRAALHTISIDEYSEAMERGDEFAPIVVYRESGRNHWIADGHHRYHAAKKAKLKTIRADVRDGNQREALLYALSANRTHGLKRTNEDKRHAVKKLLADKEWRSWSDQRIAEHCGVSVDLVASVWDAEFASNGEERPTVRKALREGREYEVDVSKINEKPRPGPKKKAEGSVGSGQMPQRVTREHAQEDPFDDEPVTQIASDDGPEDDDLAPPVEDPPRGELTAKEREHLARADRIREEHRKAAAAGAAQTTPADSLGRALPQRLVQPWALLTDLTDVTGPLAKVSRQLEADIAVLSAHVEQNGPAGVPPKAIVEARAALNAALEAAEKLEAVRPYALCENCGGAGCGGCSSLGWVPKHLWRTAKTTAERAAQAGVDAR